MDTSAGDVEGGGGEDPPAVAGRKKGRFKQLKSRLFGRLRRKETEGTIKQSKSASDVTSDVTAQGALGEYDSEDDCLDDSKTLGSRALSHDSIFQTDQSQGSPEPTRVLSQENVHGKIRALQQKLQQQNMRLGPPPLLIFSKRMEDSGATSEDDGLPQSPPDTSFHDRPGHGYPYKFPDSHRNRSCLSLAGTGSEEEEQWSSQPSSRPLSPGSPTLFSGPVSPTEPGLSQALDLTTPAQYTPSLDTSAARHRMSVKPRNQRASSKTRKGPPSSSRPRPDSQSDLDQALSEREDEEQEQERTDDAPPEAKSDGEKKREGSVEKLADHPFEPVPSSGDISALDTLPPFPEDQDLKPWCAAPPVGEEEVLPPLECPEPEGRVINNPLFLKAMPLEATTLVPPSPTTPTEAVEALQRAPKPGPNKPPMHPGPGPFTSDTHKDPGALTALTAVRARLGSDPPGLGAAERCPVRPSPPAPPASEPLLPRTPACTTGTPRAQPRGGDPETTAPTVGQEDTPPGVESAGQKGERGSGASHRFSISSARLRPKSRGSVRPEDGKKDGKEKERNGEGGKEGGEEKVGPGSARRGCTGGPVAQPEARQTEVGRKTENQRDGPVETGEDTQVERKSAFGVKLRFTSQSLKYRSEVSQSDFSKRHSYEFLANGKEPEPIRGELGDKAGSKVRGTSSQAPPQQTDVSSGSTVTELDPKPKKKTGSKKPFAASRVSDSPAGLPVSSPPEPAWMSMAREKSRSLRQQITSRPSSTEISPDMAFHSGGEKLPDQPNLQPPPGSQPQGSPSPTICSSVPSRTETVPAGNKAVLDKGQTEMSTSKPVVSSSVLSSSPPAASTAEPCLTPRNQPSWLELAKRKSKAWCDKTMD